MAGFTALTEAHGDREAISLVDRCEALLTGRLAPSDRLVKIIGDAGLLVFSDAGPAISALVKIVGDGGDRHQFLAD